MAATFSHQSSLPSLPLPTLDDTLDRYLENALVLLESEEEREQTRRAVAATRASPHVTRLQEALQTRARDNRNWLEDWWYDAYNEIRTPLIPFLSLASVNPKSPKSTHPEMQLLRVAEQTHGMLRFWDAIRKEQLPVTKSRGRVWDMNQYHVLFNSNRTPALPKDRMERYFRTESEGMCPSHVIVLYRGAVWKMETTVVDSNGALRIRPPDDLVRQLQYVKRSSPAVTHSVATLTTAHRDVWAKAREELLSVSPRNASNLAAVEQAVLVLAISDDVIEDEKELLVYSMCGRSTMQWADKSLTIQVTGDAQILTQVEHSNADAIVVLDAGDKAAATMRKEPWMPKASGLTDLPERLHFDLTEGLVKKINETEAEFEKRKKAIRACVVRYGKYGNGRLRRLKIYSDTVVQIALQLAFERVHGRFAPIYETASTRAFFHGRTETVRGCTAEITRFGDAVRKQKPTSEQLALFKRAYDKHNQLMAAATEGQGIDRHLYGLRRVHAELSRSKCAPPMELPAIFADPAWQKSGGDGNFLLSTSFIGYNADGIYGFVAAMRADGYGAFYKTHDKGFLVTITDYTGTKSDLPAFEKALHWAFDCIGTLLEEIEKQANL